ncbi:nucleotidyl transferase AbiEii/AbiGii toxin family protein [Algoriphagus sp. NF]|uniref:nucleotidyl transferase AbiEii/AbiGii toxin family protein n=1 Tax=Algoriphagus sp. NF TaxID=2992756 RepID=UPI00237B840E|nr:nucleotidyl transferase AbiEii/AbiGii toxin family protein [Algoriphagus sp. NF]MDE0559319.1 nucleotidyl transferase AbiEii/AbiGii toxin family protein [Algoriphagus sp. NF]
MITKWIEEYNPKSEEQLLGALREIMQEVALAGLYRAGFFKIAAFYGGTCLRIFYELPRFSEDLDFSLLEKTREFSINSYLPYLIEEFEALGMQVSIREKPKSINSQIESAFLKAETNWKELILEQTAFPLPVTKPTLKIKLEVDTFPPLSFQTENKLLLRPFSFYVNSFKIEDLFAGKMHALLFRQWKSRVKGRDWFDLEWYIRHGHAIHLQHFSVRAMESGHLKQEASLKDLQILLSEKIESLNFEQAKEDIIRFIPDPKAVEIWSRSFNVL